MSWNDTCAMNERLIFVAEIQRSERSMTQLCEDFGISRKTGYKWWRRYEARGSGWSEGTLAHAALRIPTRCKAAMVGLLLQARQQHPELGAREVVALVGAAASPRVLASTEHGGGDPGPSRFG